MHLHLVCLGRIGGFGAPPVLPGDGGSGARYLFDFWFTNTRLDAIPFAIKDCGGSAMNS